MLTDLIADSRYADMLRSGVILMLTAQLELAYVREFLTRKLSHGDIERAELETDRAVRMLERACQGFPPALVRQFLLAVLLDVSSAVTSPTIHISRAG